MWVKVPENPTEPSAEQSRRSIANSRGAATEGPLTLCDGSVDYVTASEQSP
jgi:hypothetical protein